MLSLGSEVLSSRVEERRIQGCNGLEYGWGPRPLRRDRLELNSLLSFVWDRYFKTKNSIAKAKSSQSRRSLADKNGRAMLPVCPNPREPFSITEVGECLIITCSGRGANPNAAVFPPSKALDQSDVGLNFRFQLPLERVGVQQFPLVHKLPPFEKVLVPAWSTHLPVQAK